MSLSQETINRRAHAYIQGATTPGERTKRKAVMFGVIHAVPSKPKPRPAPTGTFHLSFADMEARCAALIAKQKILPPRRVTLKPKKKTKHDDCCPSCGRKYDVNMGGGAYCPCAEDPPTDGVM